MTNFETTPANESPEARINSWEDTLYQSIKYARPGKEEFEGSLYSTLSNLKHYSSPNREDITDDAIEFRAKMLKLERVFDICREGYSFEQARFLFNDISFEDAELTQLLEYYFSEYYQTAA